MRIGIDALGITPNRTGGLDTYGRELIRELADRGTELVVFAQPGARAHFGVECKDVRWVEAPRSATMPKLRFATMQTWLPIRARHERVDLLHHLTNVTCLPWGFRSLLTLHDMTHEFYLREGIARDRRVRFHLARLLWSARNADHIITPSRAAADRIQAVAGVPRWRLTVVPLAPKRFAPRTRPVASLLAPGYFLAVGVRDRHKNLVRLLAAYLASGVTRPLAVAGLPGWWRDSTGEQMNRMAQRSKGRIQLLDYVPEERLADLYLGARALICPSLEEGFSLPPLEAASIGVPVAASDIAAHRETMSSAALLFDPRSEEAIAAALRSLDRDDQLCRRLAAAGSQRAQHFTWARTARSTLDVYRRVLGLPPAEEERRAHVIAVPS
jgi:glycosyltransferase involved in cell wall biosynthesis